MDNSDRSGLESSGNRDESLTTHRYEDLEYDDELRTGDHECPCPFCERTGSRELIIRHFIEHHPVYEQKHAMLFAIETGTLHLTSSNDHVFGRGGEPYREAIKAHPVFSIDQYESYFGSLDAAVDEAFTGTAETDFDPPDPLGDIERVRTRRWDVQTTSAHQRRAYGPDWGKVKLRTLDRDDWQCRVCNREWDDTTIDIHHITPARLFDSFSAMNDLSNLIALCARCHGLFERKWEHCPPDVFATRARNELR